MPTERIAVLAIGGLVGAMFVALAFWFVQERERIRASGFETGANLAHVLQEQISGSVDAIDLTLRHIGDALKLLPDLPANEFGLSGTRGRVKTFPGFPSSGRSSSWGPTDSSSTIAIIL